MKYLKHIKEILLESKNEDFVNDLRDIFLELEDEGFTIQISLNIGHLGFFNITKQGNATPNSDDWDHLFKNCEDYIWISIYPKIHHDLFNFDEVKDYVKRSFDFIKMRGFNYNVLISPFGKGSNITFLNNLEEVQESTIYSLSIEITNPSSSQEPMKKLWNGIREMDEWATSNRLSDYEPVVDKWKEFHKRYHDAIKVHGNQLSIEEVKQMLINLGFTTDDLNKLYWQRTNYDKQTLLGIAIRRAIEYLKYH